MKTGKHIATDTRSMIWVMATLAVADRAQLMAEASEALELSETRRARGKIIVKVRD